MYLPVLKLAQTAMGFEPIEPSYCRHNCREGNQPAVPHYVEFCLIFLFRLTNFPHVEVFLLCTMRSTD